MWRNCAGLLLLIALLGSKGSVAQDRILDFQAEIRLSEDGTILVKESITILNVLDGSENDEIKRGLFREFPTRYTHFNGLFYTVPFELISVKLDGEPEPHFRRNVSNGVRIFTGQEHLLLPAGRHTYEIVYQTGKQLIFHEDKDEFYWNVTGNGWSLPIERASCIIHFPTRSSIKDAACYATITASGAQACEFSIRADSSISFQTTAALSAYEGLTIGVGIEKGVFFPPSRWDEWMALLQDNAFIPILLCLVLLHFIALYWHWHKVGRDPKRGVIIPQFAPPEGMSPADVGYTYYQSYKPCFFAAAIVDHAIKRKLDIEFSKEGWLWKRPVYTFKRPAFLRRYERDDQLYEWYGIDIENIYGQRAVQGAYNSILDKQDSYLRTQLKSRIEVEKGQKNRFKDIFSHNDEYIGIGFFYVFFLFIGVVVYLTIQSSTLYIISAVALLAFAIAMQALFMRIISAYTPEGMLIRDHIQGFRMYLNAADQHVFDMLNPPEMDLQLFEKYLPYAIALQCENRWAKKFEKILQNALDGGTTPSYYRSSISGQKFRAASFSSGISSGLSKTISSASTPPSKSSGGSSGGGRSGGGGGGGGGGGW